MKQRRVWAILACAVLLLAAWMGSSSGLAADTQANTYNADDYENVKKKDLDDSWDETSATLVTLNGSSISVEGNGATADGSTLTITQEGTYVLTGELTDGQIVIEAPDDALVRVVLNGATLHCEDSAAIYCVTADKLLLILAEGTENFVSDGDTYTFPDAETDEPNAAIFSQQDLTINGTGSLTVTASYNNGIGTKDDLILVSGSIQVTAPNHAIRGRDSVTVIDASLTLDAGNDGIQSNNDGEDKGWIVLYGGSYSITAAHDGIQAETTLTIHGGTFDITSGGGSANAPERVENEGFGGGGGWGGRGNREDMPDWSEMPEMGNPEDMGFPTDGTLPEDMPSDMIPEPAAADTIPETEIADSTDETETEETTADSFKGIKAAGDLVITDGAFTIDSADDALHANGNITISGGSFTISTGDDAAHADGDLLIEGEPVITITTCYEGLEGTNVTVNGGDITINATDDGINAAGGSSNGEDAGGRAFGADRFGGGGDYLITINGGTIDITAGYDGLDSNGDIVITGGAVYISAAGVQSVGGDGAIDCDGAFTITGGTVAGVGGTAFAMIGSAGSNINADGTQPVLNFQFTDAQDAETTVELKDADGNVLVSYTTTKAFKTIALSSPDMQDGESYTVYAGGNEVYTVTLSGNITSISETGESVSTQAGPGMGGGGMGGRGNMPQNQTPRQ